MRLKLVIASILRETFCMRLHFPRFILILLALDLTKLSIFRRLSIMTTKFVTELTESFTLETNMMDSVFE